MIVLDCSFCVWLGRDVVDKDKKEGLAGGSVASSYHRGGLRMIYVWARRESFEKLESWQRSRGRQFLRNRMIDRAWTMWGKVAGSLFQPHLSSDLKHHLHHQHQYHHRFHSIAHCILLSFVLINRLITVWSFIDVLLLRFHIIISCVHPFPLVPL